MVGVKRPRETAVGAIGGIGLAHECAAGKWNPILSLNFLPNDGHLIRHAIRYLNCANCSADVIGGRDLWGFGSWKSVARRFSIVTDKQNVSGYNRVIPCSIV